MKRANWKLGLAVNSRTFPSPLWINPVFYFMFIFFGFCGSFWDWMKNTFDSWLIEKRVFYLRADSSLGGLCGSLWQKKKNVLGQDNLGPNISQKYITHTCTYSHTQKTHTFPRDWRDLLRRCITLSQKAGSLFFFFFPERPPSRLQNPLCCSSTWNMEQRWIIHNTCSFDMPNIRALCGGTGASAAAHLFPNVTRQWRLIYVPPLNHSAWMYYWYI